MTGFFYLRSELTLLVDVTEAVEHSGSGHAHVIEAQTAIVDAVETQFESHVFYEHTLAGLHLIVTDADDESIDSFVLAMDDGLTEDDCVVGMTRSIRNPELLRQSCRTIDNELVLFFVESDRSLHLRRIVAIS